MNTLKNSAPLIALLLTAAPAHASDAALLACRAIGEPAARVACYDAIPVGSAQAAGTQAASAAASENNFGVAADKRHDEGPTSIQSTVPGDFSGWGPDAQIRLANGQVWRISDGSEAVLAPMKDAKVTIERNFFGTMFMRVEGTNTSAKVRRVE